MEVVTRELSEFVKTDFENLMQATWRLNELWFEFSAAWFCSDKDVETMNSTSKLFFQQYRKGLLVQLILELTNITQSSGSNLVSLQNFCKSSGFYTSRIRRDLSAITSSLEELKFFRDNQIAHWNRAQKRGLEQADPLFFRQLEKGVDDVTSFMESLHNKLYPDVCCDAIFSGIRKPYRHGFSVVIDLVRIGQKSKEKSIANDFQL